LDITSLLKQAGGLEAMARELGVNEEQASRAATALGPAILGGFRKRAAAAGEGGAPGLEDLVARLGGEELLDNVLSKQPTEVARGNEVLGQIFGSKDVSRAVAQSAAASSGVDASVLKRMLPMLAMAVTGVMAKQGRSGAGGAAAGAGGLGGLVGGLLKGGGSGGGLGALLDRDGDGNPLDDILRMVGRGKG